MMTRLRGQLRESSSGTVSVMTTSGTVEPASIKNRGFLGVQENGWVDAKTAGTSVPPQNSMKCELATNFVARLVKGLEVQLCPNRKLDGRRKCGLQARSGYPVAETSGRRNFLQSATPDM
jgi:hypothetical protein